MLTAAQSGVQAGAMIADITPSSPAEKAGLRRGDLIIAVNGNPIVSTDVERLFDQVVMYELGNNEPVTTSSGPQSAMTATNQ